MKKISILSLHLGYGGIEKAITTLANSLCDKYQVEIASTYELYDKPAFDIDSRVKVVYLKEGLRDRAITRDLEWGIDIPIEGYDDKKLYGQANLHGKWGVCCGGRLSRRLS